MSADADAAERRLNHSIPRMYFVRGIQLITRFSYMSHNVTKCTFLAIGGGGGEAEHVMSKIYKKHIIGSHI